MKKAVLKELNKEKSGICSVEYEAIADMISKHFPLTNSDKVDEIFDFVCSFYNKRPEEIRSKTRKHETVLMRYNFICLCIDRFGVGENIALIEKAVDLKHPTYYFVKNEFYFNLYESAFHKQLAEIREVFNK